MRSFQKGIVRGVIRGVLRPLREQKGEGHREAAAHAHRWWRRRGRVAGGGRRRGGSRASVRERETDGLGRVGWEAKALEEWGGGTGPAEGQGPGGWAENLS
jgi:hypothetical protein